MQPTTMTLPAALREAARRIETGEVRYYWYNPKDCNCGVLAQVLLGVDAEQINRLAYDGLLPIGSWGTAVRRQSCPLTDLPAGHILRALADAGLTGQQIYDLEMMEDCDVRVAAGLADGDEGPRAVVAYMRAMALMLEPVPAEEPELVGAA